MFQALRSLAVLLLLIATAAGAAEIKPFAREDMASDAVRLTETLRIATASIGAEVKGKTPDQLRKEAAADVGNFGDAEKLAGAAITAAPKDPANWLAYAGVAIKADDAKADDRYDLVTRGATAAYAAYQRSTTPDAQAAALAVLADLLARHEQWRPALDALKASLDRRDAIDVRKTYEAMRAEHGFRILDYKVDNESTSPRVCFNFSEQLARKTDFSPYVAVSGSSNTAISNEDQQICVEGLKHGERYAIVLRQGLPSAVGESLLKSADYEIYVRDRSPQAHFAGKAYVLPRQGQQGAPLVTVNTSKVSIDVYRVGDRNLLGDRQPRRFSQADRILRGPRRSRLRTGRGSGAGRWTSPPRSTRTSSPIFRCSRRSASSSPASMSLPRGPGRARPIPPTRTKGETRAARRAMDGGLRPRPDRDLRRRWRARARAIAGLRRAALRRRAEARRAQQRSAGDEDRPAPTGGSISIRASRAARAARRPAFWSRPSATTTASSASPRTPSTSPTAASRGATRRTRSTRSSTPSAASTAPAKPCSRPPCFATRRAWPRPGLPLTLIVKRPDGVEYKRATLPDQGLGGRSYAIPLLSGSAAGKWSIEAYADPKGDSIGRVEFLLEDYIPERLDFTLKPAKPIIDPGEPVELSLDARFLYGAPASGLDVTGAIRLEAVEGAALAGYPGYVGGLADDDFTTVESQFTDKVQTDAKGHAELSVDLPEGSSTRPLEAKLIVDVAEPGGRTVERTVTLPVRAKSVTIGVKKNFDASLSAGDVATFEAIAVAPDGARVARKGRRMVDLSGDERLSVVQRRRPLELRAGQVVEAHRQRDRSTSAPTRRPNSRAPVGWGAHRLEIKTLDGEETSVAFDVGWSGTASADTPDNVVVTLDKTNYAPGEEAKLRIASAFAGKATVALIGDQVERFIDVDLVAGDNVVPFPVGADWGPGAYAVALTHRPLDVSARRMPGRAIGVAWFAIDRDAHKLDIALDAPQLARPRAIDDGSDEGRGPRAGRGGVRDGLGGRCRHSQSDRLQDARPGRLFLRPAQAAGRGSRSLGHADRRHAGRGRGDPFRRRHGRRRSRAICRRSSRSRSSPASSSSTARAKPRRRSICRRSTDRCG